MPKIFIRQFYEPAIEHLGPALAGFIFEQEYLTKQDRPPVTDMAAALNKFFNVIIDNLAGGNSPLLAQLIAGKFLQKIALAAKPKGQLSFW